MNSLYSNYELVLQVAYTSDLNFTVTLYFLFATKATLDQPIDMAVLCAFALSQTRREWIASRCDTMIS
jgi:hypothetical protein